MKFVTVAIAMIFALTMSAAVHAQGRGHGQAKKTTVSAPKAKPTDTPKHTTTHPTKTEKRPAKTTTTTDTRATKTEAKAARLSPDQETRMLARLPAGMTVQDASQGFKNWGQFVAAVNASNNHNISFIDLKAKMTGIAPGATEPTMTPMSLGQAMKSLGVTETTP